MCQVNSVIFADTSKNFGEFYQSKEKGEFFQCVGSKRGFLSTRREQKRSFAIGKKRVSFVDTCRENSTSFFDTSEGKPEFHRSGGKTKFAETEN